MNFHEIRFPTAISRNAQGGPERRTDVVVLGSGFEERNSRWADSRRAYNAGYSVKSIDDLNAVIEFFEERRGRLYGFRWKDHADFKSCLFKPAHIPLAGQSVAAGFEFDVPVRFDTDKLEVNLQGFRHGAIPNIALVEVRL